MSDAETCGLGSHSGGGVGADVGVNGKPSSSGRAVSVGQTPEASQPSPALPASDQPQVAATSRNR